MTRTAFLLLPCCALLSLSGRAADQPPLPRILGFSHIAVQAKNVEASVAFYRDFLGFAEQGKLMNLPPKNDTLQLVYLKICEDQWLEIFDAVHLKPGSHHLYQVALHVEDAEVMRARLEAGHVGANGRAVPKTVPRYQMRNANFSVFDPQGYHLETVQYLPDGVTLRNRGRFLPATRISDRITSATVAAGDGAASLRFYREILGFRELERIPASTGRPELIRLRLQESPDTLELVLAIDTKPRFAFAVPDLARSKAALEHSAYYPTYGRPIEIRVGDAGVRSVVLVDPMGVNVELRESAATSAP